MLVAGSSRLCPVENDDDYGKTYNCLSPKNKSEKVEFSHSTASNERTNERANGRTNERTRICFLCVLIGACALALLAGDTRRRLLLDSAGAQRTTAPARLGRRNRRKRSKLIIEERDEEGETEKRSIINMRRGTGEQTDALTALAWPI